MFYSSKIERRYISRENVKFSKKTQRKCENFGANFNFKPLGGTFTRWENSNSSTN